MENAVTGGEGRDDKVKGQAARGPGPDGQFFTTVNGTTVKFGDAMPEGERILDKAGFKPPGRLSCSSSSCSTAAVPSVSMKRST